MTAKKTTRKRKAPTSNKVKPLKTIPAAPKRKTTAKKKTAKKRAPRKPGRPSGYTEKLGERICASMATGDLTIVELCDTPGMPTRQTLHNWLRSREEFFDDFARARELAMYKLEDEITELAGRAEYEAKAYADQKGAGAIVNAIKLKIDVLKFRMACHAPRIYSETKRLEHSGPGGGPIPTEHAGLSEEDEARVAEIAEARVRGLAKAPKGARLGANGNKRRN